MNKTQAFVFFGIVLVGLCISLITLKKFGKPVEVDGPDVEPAPAVVEAPVTPPPVEPKPDTPKPSVAKSDEAPKETPSEEAKLYQSADALLGALSDSVKKRDAKQFLKMAGPDAATPLIQAQVSKLIADTSFEVDESRPTAQVAKVAGSFSRWAIRLKKSADAKLPEGAPEVAEIYTDVISKPDLGWTVEKIALPIEVAEFIGEVDMTNVAAATVDPANPTAPGSPAAPNASKGGTPNVPAPAGVESADALTVAHAFSKAVVDRNFNLARGMTDTNTITDERVAALMIAVEEGQFKLRQDEPLVVTLNRENIVWVLTRIETNPSDSSKSEFALEMAKIENEWKINGLAFNALLTALADKAGAGGTAYAPMVKNPKGGESLVIYFDFDNKEVTSRANSQLKIVATILKENPERKIRINGHADALGTDEYNKSLSNSRSAQIRKVLLDMGVAPNQVVTESFGETQPLRPNFKSDGTDDPSGRSQNRRAEVYLDF